MQKTLYRHSTDTINTPGTHSGGLFRNNFIKRSGQTERVDLAPQGNFFTGAVALSGAMIRAITAGSGYDVFVTIGQQPMPNSSKVARDTFAGEQQASINEARTDLSWYFSALRRSSEVEASKVSVNKEILSGVMALFAKKDIHTIKALLEQPETVQMPSVAIVTIARATYLGRKSLPSSRQDTEGAWNKFISSASQTLTARGEDSGKVLRGLV